MRGRFPKSCGTPAFQAWPPGRRGRQPSHLLVPNEGGEGSSGCVLSLWNSAGPSVFGYLSGKQCLQHREVLVAQDTLSLSGGQVAVLTLQGRGSSDGCKVCRTQMVSESWVSPGAGRSLLPGSCGGFGICPVKQAELEPSSPSGKEECWGEEPVTSACPAPLGWMGQSRSAQPREGEQSTLKGSLLMDQE